ncbi:hypothetical protein [Streptomyces orinoci]|uniref:Uncharacterized protein n=1 Tax=Streptomyces orinoci TaxID=67339 RepID=A0ABV3K1L1_STRON|nr:hypothetical protein [Streptomyces orinoci]
MSEQNQSSEAVYRRRPDRALGKASEAEQRSALAAYIAERPQLAAFARDMVRAFEEHEAADVRARLAAAGAARKAWKKYEPEVPALILDARAAGVSGVEIAADLGMNPSYVFRILREKVRYSYRIDVFNDPDIGLGWQADENGEGVADANEAGGLADPDRLADEHRQGMLGVRRAHLAARVLMWKGPDMGLDDEAVYVREWPAAEADKQ